MCALLCLRLKLLVNIAHKKVSVELKPGEPLRELATPDGERSNVTSVHVQIVRNSYLIESFISESCTNFKCSFPIKIA